MERYELNDNDKKLIEIGLDVLEKNFDDGVYNHILIISSRKKFLKTADLSTRLR